MRTCLPLLALLAVQAASCSAGPAAPPSQALPPDTARLPLTEAPAAWRYLGRYETGLYANGNTVPAAHLAAGLERAAAIVPRDAGGVPHPDGRYVLLSIGMSNATQEFCSAGTGRSCDAWTFMGRAAADPAVEHRALVLVNGARGGQTASAWTSPQSAEYDRIRDTWLTPLGVTERQVQAAWVKVANAGPRVSLPAPDADAYQLVAQIGQIARALRQRYPNLQQVLLSSRIYAGYATTTLNPEPYAYESGLAVKWVIQAQVDQMATGRIDARAGDLRVGVAAPWLAWGPYLWARGAEARGDGLAWLPADFASDGTHPSTSGRGKVGAQLLDFFKASPATRPWFLVRATPAPSLAAPPGPSARPR